MKHIKLFENFDENKFNIEDAHKWLLENYTSDKIDELFDEEVASGNWIDSDQMEEEGYEEEYDYYMDFGRGEAEDAVVEEIIRSYEKEFDIKLDTNQHIEFDEKIREEFDVLRDKF